MKNISMRVASLLILSGTFSSNLQASDVQENSNQKTNKIGKNDASNNKSSGSIFISKKIKSDEYVLFYPALAAMDVRQQYWVVDIHGLIYEHTAFSKSMPFVASIIGPNKLKPLNKFKSLYKKRLGWFFVDNEGRKQLKIKLKGKVYEMQPSGANGHFKGIIKIPVTEVKRWSLDSYGRVRFKVVTTAHDKRVFKGEIYFIPPRGVSVISDIDDTIKLSEVHDKKKLIRNTFFRPYKDIPGMSRTYSKWYKQHKVKFHYVTSSPWQLYVPLRKFMESRQFPPGSFHMKYFRIKDKSFFNVFSKSVKYKVDSITRIMTKFPYRYFILVGDSGEKDLQVYTEINKRFPGRVNVIYIRNTGHSHKQGDARQPSPAQIDGCPVIVFKTNSLPAQLKYHGPRHAYKNRQSKSRGNR